MMLFDYDCPRCGTFEAWGSAGDKHRCPKCRKLSVQKVSAPGFTLDYIKEGFPRAWRRWAEQHEKPVKRYDWV